MRASTASLLFACACGTAAPPPDPPGAAEPEVVVDARAPLAREMSVASRLALDGAAERLGTTAAGHPLVVVEGAVQEVLTSGLVARTLFAAPGDPTALGAVAALAPRAAGGAWVAAASGLFTLEGHYLSHLALDVEGAPTAVGEGARGPLAGLWLATTEGLYHRTPEGRLERLDRGESMSMGIDARQWAVEPEGRAALALDSAGVVMMIEAPVDRLVAHVPVLDAGVVHALAAGPGVLWAAAERGLLRWRSTSGWTLFTLGTDPGTPVRAVAVDPTTGAAWATTAGALVHADVDGTLSTGPLPAEASLEALAVDATGDVWLASGDDALVRVTRAAASEAVTFAGHVAPWITTHCARCHQNATADFDSYEVFAERAEAALIRVRTGDMPRCEGGLPCPAEQRLAAPDYVVLESWIRQGKPR